LAMIDSIGKPESGVLQGNLKWLGAYDQCRSVKATEMNTTTNMTESLFDGKYCTNFVDMSLPIPGVPPLGLLIGSCLPHTCTDADATVILYTAVGTINPLLSVLGVKLGAKYAHCPEKLPLDSAAIGMIVLLTIIGTALLAATLYDLVFVQSGSPWISQGGYSMNSKKRTLSVGQYSTVDNTATTIQAVSSGEKGILPLLALKLSMYSNATKLLSTDKQGGSLECIHGIRFFSMTWVLLGHTYFFAGGFVDNLASPELANAFKDFWFQCVANATVSVDTFFLLSGTLGGYLLLKEIDKKDGPVVKKLLSVKWWLFYFHRFWRLSPPYLILIGISTALFSYVGDGPMWYYIQDPPKIGLLTPQCRHDWWTNLLYINNLIKGHYECFGWSWYLAVDMQYFIVSPLFIIALYVLMPVGVGLCSFFGLASIITTALLTHYGASNKDYNAFYSTYISPATRFAPYATGMLLGYAIFKSRMKYKMKWYTNAIGWALAFGIAVATLYGKHGQANGHVWSQGTADFYEAMFRFSWSVSVAWVIFACVNGYGGPVNALLSWSAIIPLSRLTYMTYLIHPMVLTWFYQSRRDLIHFTHSQMVWYFLGNLCVTYGMAIIASLAFEAPMMGLEKVVFHNAKTSSGPAPEPVNAAQPPHSTSAPPTLANGITHTAPEIRFSTEQSEGDDPAKLDIIYPPSEGFTSDKVDMA